MVRRNVDDHERARVVGLLRERSTSELYAILEIMDTERLKIAFEGDIEKLDECNFAIQSYQRDILGQSLKR